MERRNAHEHTYMCKERKTTQTPGEMAKKRRELQRERRREQEREETRYDLLYHITG